jgi:hypothetical protein
MASKVIVLSIRSAVEAKSALIVFSSPKPCASSRELDQFEQGGTTVARHRNFVHVPAVAPQTQRVAGAKGKP